MLLYGAFPSDEVPQDLPIKPGMAFTAPVVEIRDVKAGTPISYGGVYPTEKDTRIAVVQPGFADGVPRPWYVDGFVKFKDQNLKITGKRGRLRIREKGERKFLINTNIQETRP
ncbi:MAG: hypothetical protein Ct9H90mP15_05590 [Candidatus Neomarinimicrobiota bacterium]|nr:MAG: hypothetical protein Ct9H90mP15_05590 [Candidatus Neomarinimicrobiota bacterium]